MASGPKPPNPDVDIRTNIPSLVANLIGIQSLAKEQLTLTRSESTATETATDHHDRSPFAALWQGGLPPCPAPGSGLPAVLSAFIRPPPGTPNRVFVCLFGSGAPLSLPPLGPGPRRLTSLPL